MFVKDDVFHDSAIVVVRAGSQFFVEEVPEERLSRRALIALLKLNQFPAHEIAFMFTEFKLNPGATKAYFGMNRTFLYCS